MKKLFSVITLVVLSMSLNAQQKTTVGILPLSTGGDRSSQPYVSSIQDAIINSFVKTKRFIIVDRSKLNEVSKERELQKSESFIDGTVIEAGKNYGAQYLISGNINSASASELTYRDDKGYNKSGGFKAKLSVTLNIIDITTGQVVKSETIEPKAGSMLAQMTIGGASSADEAISRAMKNIESKVDEFVSLNFPMEFSIAEIQEKGSDGDAEKILIAGGTEFGLKKGMQMKVIEISQIEVAGKMLTRKKEIGILQINKVEDENFSTCNVKSGGSLIATKFDSKADIKVITLK